MRDGQWAGNTDSGQAPIAPKSEAEAAALLAAGRELIAEARRILADAPFDTSPRLVEPVLYQSLPDEATSFDDGDREPPAGISRRLVALVPAAAGIALLGAGLAALGGNHPDHALTVESQRSSTGAPPAAASPPTAAPSQTAAAAPEVPLSLSVPRLRSVASVAGEVSVQTSGPENGLLDAPSDYHQLGWYRHGGSGALVLDGHVGYRSDPGPLAFIGSLASGDQVIVNFPSGQRAFAVTVVGRAVKGQLPQQYFTTQYDQDLMLITCDYTSPFRAGHFLDNVYVIAAPTQ